jgi:hypothetical protein
MAAGLLVPAGVAQAASSAPAPAPHQGAVWRTSALTFKTATGTVRVVNAPTAAGPINGCPYGDACMYTIAGWNSGRPEHKYYNYACYNLSNEYGTRVILNNQYGGALVTLYYNYGCSNPAFTVDPQNAAAGNITPINSIRLYLP